MARRSTLVAAGLVLVATVACSEEALETVNPGESSGEVCSPVDAEGVASFSWESVTNTSDQEVRVLRVEVEEEKASGSPATRDVSVDEWFLTPLDWEPAAVRSGPLERPGDSLLPTVVGPSEEVLVSMALKAEGLESPRTVRPRVTYRQGGKERTVVLSFVVSIVPHGAECPG